MGSLSILHWLLLILVVFVLWLVVRLLRPNRMLRHLSRLAEGRHFRRPDRPPPKLSTGVARPRFLAVSAILLGSTLAPAAAVFLVPRTPDSTVTLIQGVAVFMQALGLAQTGALIVAVVIHFRPNADRSTKYALLTFGVGALPTIVLYTALFRAFETISLSFGQTLDQWLRFQYEHMQIAILFFLCIQPAVWLGLYDLAWRRWYREAVARPEPAGFSRSFRVMRRTSTIAILAASISVLYPISLALLVWRYYAIEAARQRPIVFLRSFSHAQTITVFGAVVAKIASRYGIIVAIVHATQRGSDLFASTDAVNIAATVTVADDAWQDWVEAQLARASAVIIDRSQDTEGVRWEIARAIERVPIPRIALLHGAEQSPMAFDGFQLAYSLDGDGVRHARDALDSWFRGMIKANSKSPS